MVGLFQASSGAIFLLDEARGELAPDPNSLVGVMEEKVSVFHPIFVDDPEYRLTVSGSQRPFLSGRLSVDRRVLTFYRPLVTGLGLESAIVVPLVSREKTLGELMLGSDKIEFFNNYDLQVISTAAGQLASAIESLHLLSQTDETLRHRVERLTSIARISREMAASLDLDHLLYVIHDETVRAISADCGSVLYLDPEAGANDLKVFRSVGCPYTGELSPLERSAIDKGQLVQIDDFGQGGFFPPHDGVRSALVIPPLSVAADAATRWDGENRGPPFLLLRRRHTGSDGSKKELGADDRNCGCETPIPPSRSSTRGRQDRGVGVHVD